MDDDLSLYPAPERLRSLSLEERPSVGINRRYTSFVRSLRFILPLLAIVMTVIVLTWEQGGRVAPMKKEELLPQSENIQNELLNPVFTSVDSKNQPYKVTAERAVQNRNDPNIVELTLPSASVTMTDGVKLEGMAETGIYEQKSQKLNLDGDVVLNHSGGYVLETQELRIDIAGQRAFSGQNVHVKGPEGTLDATGLEGDTGTGALIFNGPAKVVLYSGGKLLPPKESEAP
jgi:lipopolysaccharide export system protein LptC